MDDTEYLMIPKRILNDRTLSPTMVLLYARLVYLAEDKNININYMALSEIHGCTTKSMKKYLLALHDAKLIRLSGSKYHQKLEILG